MKNMIEIAGNRYEVRVINGERQVKLDGKWIPAMKFIDALQEREQTEQLFTLAEYGRQILKRDR
jgi:hypothetical protein